jgi:hypothetical protein
MTTVSAFARRAGGLAALGAILMACGSSTPPPFEPYQPPPFVAPAVDEPFLQETNHTTNEVEAGIGALLGVVLPPAAHAAFDRPTQVTPRGLVRHTGGTFEVLGPGAAEPDLVAAAASGGGLYVATAATVYAVAPDGSFVPFAAPAGATVTGLAGGAAQVYVLTTAGLGWVTDAGAATWPAAGGAEPTAVVEDGTTLYVATAAGVAAHDVPTTALGAARFTLGAAQGLAVAPVRALVAAVTVPQPLDLVVVGEGGVQGVTVAGATPSIATVPLFAAGRVPLGQPRAATRTSDGGFVVATAGGAMRPLDRGAGPEWRVYNAERWVPAEDVRAVATDPSVADGPLWFATAGGLGTVTAVRQTLEEKLVPFIERIVARHDRDGAVADSHLTRRGDLTSNIPWDSDNDGSWTSYWLLGECFRYQVTGDADARAHVDRSLEAMLRLRDVTGTDYFLARAVIRKEGCQLDDCDDPGDGVWFTSPDGVWWVKRDTSNDEVNAHVFMMGHLYDLCADDAQRERIRAHLAGIVGGIIDHGWQLIDPVTGVVTTYGQWDPAYVNEDWRGRFGDGGHRSLEIMASLTLAHYLTGEQRFLDAKQLLIDQHHYADNAVSEADGTVYPGRPKSADNDEMATNAWWSLLRYEPDPALRARWLEGWATQYECLQPQQGALWDVTNAVVGGAGPDPANTLRWLRQEPVDLIRWEMRNSHRLDLLPSPEPHVGGGIRSDGRILPVDERPNDRWNTDQYRLDGGWGPFLELDGGDVLASYWMARYYGFIVPRP